MAHDKEVVTAFLQAAFMATATSFFVQILTNFVFTDESIITAPKDASESSSSDQNPGKKSSPSPFSLLKLPSKNSI
jgi:hypothetical protein